MNTLLAGHSGCKLELIQSSGESFVRKTSKSKLYNDRLHLQMNKQKQFSSSYFHTPEVLNSGFDDQGLFFFDMEYILGKSLSSAIEDMSIGDIKPLAIAFANLESSPLEKKEFHLSLYAKLDEIQKSPNFESRFQIFMNFLYAANWKYLSPSSCHGDLTLENVLLSGDKLYLIDFLDSFYDSWLFDAAKLFQDIVCHWSYRTKNTFSTDLSIRLGILKKEYINTKKKTFEGDDIEGLILLTLMLNLLRILPYANNTETIEYLYHQLLIVKEKINSGRIL